MDVLDNFDLGQVRRPDSAETYNDYMSSFGFFSATGFVFRELVRNSTRHAMPPRSMWHRMVPTFLLAMELRARMLCHGATGLVVNAAYRPAGGEADSLHKHNAALDLDLEHADVRRDPKLLEHFAGAAADLWKETKHLRTGFGTYAPDGEETTRRVHIDTFYRWRCWQGIGYSDEGRALFSKRPAALRLVLMKEDDPEYLACIADGLPHPDETP
jgi:hypothetical protein